ncbi:MAG: response regulator transcription factor [Novosphingobium sp.]
MKFYLTDLYFASGPEVIADLAFGEVLKVNLNQSGSWSTLPESGEGNLSFQALGKDWNLIDPSTLERGTLAAGIIEVDGQRYAIVPGQVSPVQPAGRFASEVVDVLTPRELQVCELIAAGRCDKQIARMLGISPYTEREHVRRIFAKLKISSRSAVLPTILGLVRVGQTWDAIGETG